MTTLDTALAVDPHALGEYRGKPVIKTNIAITNAGDGLSKAMGIAPQVLEPGDTVMVLLECEVGEHGFTLVPDTDCYALKQKLRAGTAVIVDDKASASKLRKQADKITKASEQTKGVERLDGTDAEDLEGDGERPDDMWGAEDEGGDGDS